MRPKHGFRLRAGGMVLTAALLAVAILALPAIGKNGGGGSKGPRAAGTIESFEDGQLVVALAKGGTISAKVVRRTKIRCGRDGRDHRRSRRGSDRGQGASGGEAPQSQPADADGRRDKGRRGRCNAGDLVPGATVKRAEIVLTHGKALYKKIGLLPAAATEPPEEEPAS